MTKEKITFKNIQQDFLRIVKWQLENKLEWRLCFIVPITLIAVILGFVFRRLWVGMVIFLVAGYHIFHLTKHIKEYFVKKRLVKDCLDCNDISISIENFSHIAKETIYEPHRGFRMTHTTKIVKMYYFRAVSWRDPIFDDHYRWSKDFSISSRGLDNISISGDEFLYISLSKYNDIAYIYPCKYFDLDSDLIK